MKNFMVVNLGCKVNAYETDAIANMLEEKGLILNKDSPDLIVINTCSVTATSDSKSRQKIRHLSNKYPNAIICVMGCYSQMNATEASDICGVGVVIGTKYRDKILDFALEYENTKKKIVMVEDTNKECEFENLVVYNFYQNTRAYLKIQDGCNNFCSYCIIPYTRGRVRSKKPDLIIKEAQTLVDRGYFELVLTGIHTGAYGQEFQDYDFYHLLLDLVNKVKGLKRLRISSIEVNELTDDIVRLMKENKIIVNHLHVPIQSGSTATLKRMNRKYDVEKFKEKIKFLKDNINDLSITTDIIVGFPGESEEEFKETYATLKELEFSRLHVFPFSSRKGTPASTMPLQIDGNIKKQRVNELIILSKELEKRYYSKHLNDVCEVLFEENKDGYYKGYTTNYIKVRVRSNIDLKGKMVYVNLLTLVDTGMDYEIEGEVTDGLC